MQKILITGATGLIGRHLVDRLQGEAELFLLTRKQGPQKEKRLFGDLAIGCAGSSLLRLGTPFDLENTVRNGFEKLQALNARFFQIIGGMRIFLIKQ